MAVSSQRRGDYRGDVLRVAVIGGIGSGKTAVTDYLAERGAGVVDADVVARSVVEVGRPAWQQLRDAFGDGVLAPDRTLDRALVAEIVFNDPSALRRLNRITHGAIGIEIVAQLEALGPRDLAVIALPLYRKEHREIFKLDEVWCVDAPVDVAIARLTGPRALSEADARARIAAQPTNDERLAVADVALHNAGTLEDLHRRIDEILDERGLLRG